MATKKKTAGEAKRAAKCAKVVATPQGVPRYDLLAEPLLGTEHRSGARARVTLPGLLERLGRGDLIELTGVQAHQQHAVHAFLVQVAAMALHLAGDTRVARSEDEWRAALLTLADGSREAWCLLVPDLSKPAFMQPPVPEGTLENLKSEHLTPVAELDLLVTAKSHDLKARRPQPNDPELWIYSLVALQTMQGFLGRGNYGISRMNGGFGSRPGLALAPDATLGRRFARDTAVLLATRAATAKNHGYPMNGGLCLVWTAPWDGADSIPLSRLDPYYVEICRRVRLVLDGRGVIVAHRGNSQTARVAGAERLGDTGDPWVPVNVGTGRALTVSASGWAYERLAHVLFSGDWRRGPAADLTTEDGDAPVVVARVLVRGQGETGGYHERVLPIPPKSRGFFRDPSERERVATMVEHWIEFATLARRKVLRVALCCLFQGAPEKLKLDDDRTDPWLVALERGIDAQFFQLVFEHGASERDVADRAFQTLLVRLVREQFEAAIHAAPVPIARRPRAVAQADGLLGGLLRKHFTTLDQLRSDAPTAASPAPFLEP